LLWETLCLYGTETLWNWKGKSKTIVEFINVLVRA